MTLTKDLGDQIKKQIIDQLERLNNPNKDQIKKYIEGLNEAELEDFLKKNNIEYKTEVVDEKPSAQAQKKEPECIFCKIVKNQIPSYKISENKKSIVILEINPLSKGHSIIVPFKHGKVEEIPKSVMTLSQKVAKKIMKKFKAEDIKIETTNFMGHALLNVIPIYKDQPLQKKELSEKELKDIQYKLEIKKRRKRKNENSKKNNKQEKATEITSQSENQNKKSTTIIKEKTSGLPKVSFRIP